jgi:hypothetical protein
VNEVDAFASEDGYSVDIRHFRRAGATWRFHGEPDLEFRLAAMPFILKCVP